jgi:hypothetical protein
MYHNFGVESSGLPLRLYDALPQENGYRHLTEARAAETGEAWQTTFAQPASKLRLTMLAAPGTTVVEGEGLGPDLRVPVPFAMARRQGTRARFAVLYEPYKLRRLRR